MADVTRINVLLNITTHARPVVKGSNAIITFMISCVGTFRREIVDFLENSGAQAVWHADALITSAVVKLQKTVLVQEVLWIFARSPVLGSLKRAKNLAEVRVRGIAERPFSQSFRAESDKKGVCCAGVADDPWDAILEVQEVTGNDQMRVLLH